MADQQTTVETIARAAGEIALRHFGRLSCLSLEAKGHLDLVTAADRDVETFIQQSLATHFPDDGILGEEGASSKGRSGRVWVIDPIDGTFNFVRGSEHWGVSIGLFEDNAPSFGVVNLPARKEIFVGGGDVTPTLNGAVLPPLPPFNVQRAAVGLGIHPNVPNPVGLALIDRVMNDMRVAMRITGSSVISMIDIVKGTVDGYIGLGIPSWDLMGILPTLEKLGAVSTIEWKSVGLSSELNFVCGTPGLLEMPSLPKLRL